MEQAQPSRPLRWFRGSVETCRRFSKSVQLSAAVEPLWSLLDSKRFDSSEQMECTQLFQQRACPSIDSGVSRATEIRVFSII